VPYHMHVSEQPAEVAASVAAWGMRPVELLAACGVVDARLTAIHATHLVDDEVALLGGAAATVCACPTTERDLGDGMLQAQALLAAGAEIAIGSDSQTIIDPFEELRLVEYNERLRSLQRVVLGHVADQACHTAPALLRMGGAAGAAALRFAGGEIRGGAVADLVAVDLRHRALAGWSADSLAAAIALSAPAEVVSDVWVDGTRVVTDREHAGEAAAQLAFARVAAS
jgi:formimidoylglutamate deiminase